MIRRSIWLGIAVLAATLAGCDASSPIAAASPTPDVPKLYLAAAAKSNAPSAAAGADLTAALTANKNGQLDNAGLLVRAQADFKKVAAEDDGFIADLLKIPFPTKDHQDLVDLVKAVTAHRDACAAIGRADIFTLSADISKANDANTQVGAAVDIIRADLGLPRASPAG